MNENIWGFMGIQRMDQTESDRLLTSIMKSMMNSLFHVTHLSPSDFSSFTDMVKYGIELNDDYSYFWDWMNEYGLDYIEIMGKTTLTDTEETLDFLAYRQMLLEMDIENEIVFNLFLSISELLTAVNEFIQMRLESAATYQEYDLDISGEPIICEDSLNSDKDNINIEWKFSLSSAVNQQSFCYNFH